MQKKKFHMSAGFALMMTAVYFFDTGGMFMALLVCALVHELGHFLAIIFFGSRVCGVNLELTGAVIFYDNSRTSYSGEMMIAFTGPLMGLVFSVITAAAGRYNGYFYILSGVSVSLSLLNLLPAQNLDGGRMLYAFLAHIKDTAFAENALIITSCTSAFVLMTLGTFVFITTRSNFSFLLVGLWLLFDFLRVGGTRIVQKK